LLYRIGIQAGFLKRDERVQSYLAAMRRIYHKVPSLVNDDYEEPGGSDLEEWSDEGPPAKAVADHTKWAPY
jgi:hypothetical protein